MGQLDDAVRESVPGNDFVKPLMIAAGALILGHIFGVKKDETPAQTSAPGAGAAPAGGGLLGNLGGMLGNLASSQLGGAAAGAAAGTAITGGLDSLLNQFRNAGHAEKVDSWVGTGQNAPIAPNNIDEVIGQDKIKEIAAEAGISPEQMSQLLAQALPKLVDKLTPGGQIRQG